ncbi:MAG: hypothetical protein HRU50_15815 [Winogradskyella sp.]|uniref:hypothetical protein n=1 Tax=Winogradskyella sp. TaxID=1883156 RepID=UPI0025D3CB02|nr:hypothetical protein [Winogradskyella sp.]NRB61387.1 hypothetical protein [Winogradskyella sp.]
MKAKISIRIDDDIKVLLEDQAEQKGQTVSTYAREILESHVNQENYREDELISESSPKIPTETFIINVDSSLSFVKSFGFTYLLSWMLAKSLNHQCYFSNDALKGLRGLIESAIDSRSFSRELRMGFTKVLNDLNRVIIEPENHERYFWFPLPNHHGSFNYFLLVNEVLRLKY